MSDRVAALARRAEALEAEIGESDRREAEDKALIDEEMGRRLHALGELIREMRDLDAEDGGPTPEQLERQEKALRLVEIHQRMRHAEERQKAFLEAAKRANQPLKIVRDSRGNVIGAE